MAAITAFLEKLRPALAEAGVEPEQCEFDAERGSFVIYPLTGGTSTTRVVPLVSLAAHYAVCKDEGAREALLAATVEAFGHGAADVPVNYADCGRRLLPQLWCGAKVAARRLTLPDGTELPHCGLHGEEEPLTEDALGVVLVYEYVAAEGSSVALPIETPVLSGDLSRWGVSFVEALRNAMGNLRSRTKDGPPPEKRWEHHPSGCGQSVWCDRFDAARAALLPALVAKRKRSDGVPEPGGQVVAFATTSCALAATAKNALGLCFMGDTLHTKIGADGSAAAAAGQILSTTPYRLLKMRDSRPAASTSAGSGHPLVQKASEGFVWQWLPYIPGGPPLRTPGEFSVPESLDEVNAILEAAEAGRPVPVFTAKKGAAASSATSAAAAGATTATFAAQKEKANALFKEGNYIQAIAAYDAALASLPAPSDAEAAVAHANAAQALLNLAAADEDRRVACAAEALRRAARSAELDSTYAKAHARCAAACDILGETAAAAEFRVKAEACTAAAEATRAAQRAEAERKREAQAAAKAAAEAVAEKQKEKAREEAAREALLQREKEREKERAMEETAKAKAAVYGDGASGSAPGAGSLGLEALFGLDSGVRGSNAAASLGAAGGS